MFAPLPGCRGKKCRRLRHERPVGTLRRMTQAKPDPDLLQAAILEAAAAHGVAAQALPPPPAGPFRVGALLDLARAGKAPPEECAFGPFVMLVAEAALRRADGTMLRLTEKERDIILALHAQRGRAMERHHLLEAVWGYVAEVETHTLETHIYRLRQKIEDDPARPALLLTDGQGYRLIG